MNEYEEGGFSGGVDEWVGDSLILYEKGGMRRGEQW